MTHATGTIQQPPVDQRHPHGRVGLIVPCANPSAEPETSDLLRGTCAVHTTRFPPLPGWPLADRLAAYTDLVPDMIGTFGSLTLDSLMVACSGSQYLLGPEQDEATCAKLSSTYGLAVGTSTLATRHVLRQLGVDDLVLISPYKHWLTEHARVYWRRAGIRRLRVVSVQAADGTHEPYRVSTSDLLAQIERATLPDDAVVLCTGTGMATLQALPLLGAGNQRVLLSSNIAGAWWLACQSGPIVPERLPWALRRLLDQGLTP
ncbi:maleate cis-trans isomerase family protein [Nonomuraea sp. NPDC003707]